MTEHTFDLGALTQSQWVAMLSMQDEHNRQVHPQWDRQGYPFYRAIWVEAAEILSHYGWKWWKHKTSDIEQVKLELVDIFHFALSQWLTDDNVGTKISKIDESQEKRDTEIAVDEKIRLKAEALFCHYADVCGNINVHDVSLVDFIELIEDFIQETLRVKALDLEKFTSMLCCLSMTWNDVFALYCGKNVLNQFRQSHGYKEGHYIKHWDGREDNEHLMELIQNIDWGSDVINCEALLDQLQVSLSERYETIVQQQMVNSETVVDV